MKRFSIAVILLAGVISAYAQDVATPTLNYDALEKKLEKSNEDIKDAKDKLKDRTWENRGELFLDIHEVNVEFVRLGMASSETKIYMKEPNEVRTIQEGGKVTEQHIYDRITLIYENDVLTDYIETKVIHPDPLPLALEAFNKALELDEKGKNKRKVRQDLDDLKRMAETDGVRHFTSGRYEEALEKFELILETSESPVYENVVDSVIIYNCALAAKNMGNHELSAKYYEQVIDINYGGSDAYFLLKQEYIELGDSAKALDILLKGHEAYPDTSLLLFELVNYYLNEGNAEEGMKYLDMAVNKEPNNPSIYFAKGTLLEKVGEKDMAMEAYLEALEKDPEFFNAWFNIGALYFNNAVELYDIANTKEDLDEYNAAKATADDELKLAIEPMEKAHQLNPEEKAALETLQTIYYRLQMTEEYEAVKKKLEAM
jgi:tetratricopeptide (TPR) repeat protein